MIEKALVTGHMLCISSPVSMPACQTCGHCVCMFALHASAQTGCLQYITDTIRFNQAPTNPALRGCAYLSEALKNTKAGG